MMKKVYEHTLTSAELCRRLGVQRSRVEQWVNRGLIKPESDEGQGKSRRWTFREAMRLTILIDVADANLPLQSVGEHSQLLTEIDRHAKWIHGFENEPAFLVVGYGPVELIPSTPRGSPGIKKGEGIKVFIPGQLDSDIVRPSKLMEILMSPDDRLFIVIPLEQVERRVREVWEASLEGASAEREEIE